MEITKELLEKFGAPSFLLEHLKKLEIKCEDKLTEFLNRILHEAPEPDYFNE